MLDDQADRIAARVAESVARRERRAAVRRELVAARTAGLLRRHATKTSRLTEEAAATQKADQP